MDPTPDFKDKRGKEDGDRHIGMRVWIARRDFADSLVVARGVGGWNAGWVACPWRHEGAGEVDRECDRRGIVSLSRHTQHQYKELRETLSKPPGLRII